jgi:Mrr N-terminal domain
VPQITLSTPTYQRLLRQAASFEDTAEDVINRLLDGSEGTEPSDQLGSGQAAPRRASPGSILPEREYWIPILTLLAEQGGAAAATDVIDALGERMRDVLTPGDFEVLRMGEVRWRNRARFARLRMRERGLLSSSSPRGVWEMTMLGRQYLAQGGAER